MRRLWIMRINAAARQQGTTYSRLMAGMRKVEIGLNRKMLADLAVRDPRAFAVFILRFLNYAKKLQLSFENDCF